MRDGLRNQLGEEILSVYDRDAEAMGAGDMFEGALRTGDPAPPFRLPDARGGEVALEDLLADGPVVLVFYRGAWCPYCNLQLAAFQSALADIRAAGAALVAISPQTPDSSLSSAQKNALEFEVLSDVGNRVARDYGLVFRVGDAVRAAMTNFGIDLAKYNADDSWELPVPGTFVVAPDGVIRLAHVDADYTKRLEPAEIVAALRSLG
jgi:peroxiredoxin